jgi:hypothetical protein
LGFPTGWSFTTHKDCCWGTKKNNLSRQLAITRLRFFVGKLLSKWEGPFIIEELYRSGVIKIASLKDNTTQVVNGQRLKHYISRDSYNEDVDVIQMVTLEEFIKEHMQETAESVFE